MAARTSAGAGVIITISLLGVVAFALFVITVILYGDNLEYAKQLEDADATSREYVREVDRADPAIQTNLESAKRENASLVRYYQDMLDATYQKVTGNGNDRLEELSTKTSEIDGASTGSLLSVMRSMESQIESLERQLDDAEAARLAAQTSSERERDRVQALQQEMDETTASMQARIDGLEADAAEYRGGYQGLEQQYLAQISDLQTQLEETEERYRSQVRDLQRRNLELEDQVSQLQLAARGESLQATPEQSLVDGTIANTLPSQNEVFISIGRRQNVILGMTFAVYSDATQIRPDAEGNYPRGKASIEVINVGETSSRCRILSERAGNPVVQGDVIANAVYDPNKVYKFLIAGNFDTNGDGRQTPAEQAEITALIEEWGGKTTDELDGDVDFLILGRPPVLPPPPGVGDPIEIVDLFVRRERELNRYNDLLDKAQRTSVPVLNENRLYTLIGRVRSRTR